MAKPFPNLRALTHEVQTDLGNGRDVDKPRSRSRYTPGRNNVRYVPPGKYFQYSEIHQMVSEIYRSGEATRSWFEEHMARVSKHSPCNFTAMGALLKHLGYATYPKEGVYRKSAG
jgi:hypothetical protein